MFKDLIKRIATELSRRDVPYMIIGGQAVLHYGEPRLTKDIDITLGLGLEKLGLIKDVAKAVGMGIAAKDAFIKETMVLPAADKKRGCQRGRAAAGPAWRHGERAQADPQKKIPALQIQVMVPSEETRGRHP